MNAISTLPALVQAFFMDRLMQQRRVSPHTVASYRDAFRLFQYAQQRLGKAPSNLTVPDLDTPLLAAFLEHLERDRKNSPRSRATSPLRSPRSRAQRTMASARRIARPA